MQSFHSMNLTFYKTYVLLAVMSYTIILRILSLGDISFDITPGLRLVSLLGKGIQGAWRWNQPEVQTTWRSSNGQTLP